jgi:hypothetical protein
MWRNVSAMCPRSVCMLYGGDIMALPRRMWHPQTLEEHALDWTLYETFAQIASKAEAAPG